MGAPNRAFSQRKIAAVQRLRRSTCFARADALTGEELCGRGEGVPLPATPIGRLAWRELSAELRRRRDWRFLADYLAIMIVTWERRALAAVVSHRQFMQLTGCGWMTAQRAQRSVEQLELVRRVPWFESVSPDFDPQQLKRARRGLKHAERAYALHAGPRLERALRAAELHLAGGKLEGRRRLELEVAKLKAKDAGRGSVQLQVVGPVEVCSPQPPETQDHQNGDPTDPNSQRRSFRTKGRGQTPEEHSPAARPFSISPPRAAAAPETLTREAPTAPPLEKGPSHAAPPAPRKRGLEPPGLRYERVSDPADTDHGFGAALAELCAKTGVPAELVLKYTKQTPEKPRR